MTRRRSTIKGAAGFRRMLRQIEPEAKAELVKLLNSAGPVLAQTMKAELPSRTGRLRAAIGFRVLPASLSLKVGLLSKATQRQFFYGHILDVGRKAKTVAIRSGPRAGSSMRIKPLQALRVVRADADLFRSRFLPDYRKLMDAVLLRAAQGGGDD